MNHHELLRLAKGRRLMHFSLLGWLSVIAFKLNSTPLLLPLLLLLSGAAMTGSARVASAIGMQMRARWACVLGAAVPMAGLLVMGWLSSKARQQLLAAGWSLGMFEAHPPPAPGRFDNEPQGRFGNNASDGGIDQDDRESPA